MSEQNKGQLDAIFKNIQVAFIEGKMRRLKSEATVTRLFDFLVKLRSDATAQSTDALATLHKIPSENFLSAAYVFDISQLIYSLALLDALLHNVTLYMLLRFPDNLKKQTLSGELLLSGRGIGELITELARKKARDISYSSIEERLGLFRKSFGLSIDIPEKILANLNNSIEIRNHVIHNESMVTLSLNDNLEMRIIERSSEVRPIEFQAEDLEGFINAHEYVADELTAAMYLQVLKEGVPEYLRLRRARNAESSAG